MLIFEKVVRLHLPATLKSTSNSCHQPLLTSKQVLSKVIYAHAKAVNYPSIYFQGRAEDFIYLGR